MRSVVLASLLLVVAACGDNTNNQGADAPSGAIDARADGAPPDGAPCVTPTGYPEALRAVEINLEAPRSLTLSGTGTRCEQIVAALTDATGRPPELAELDTSGLRVGDCFHDDVLDREIVRLFFDQYAGLPIYQPVQNVLAHVDVNDDVVFLAGEYVPAGHAPPAGCLDATEVAAAVPGARLEYTEFAACSPTGSGMYTVASDDQIEPVATEGIFLGADGMRRVRAVDVYLLPAHVTATLIGSDLFCCDPGTVEHCVGKRLFVDAFTGDVVGERPHCLTC